MNISSKIITALAIIGFFAIGNNALAETNQVPPGDMPNISAGGAVTSTTTIQNRDKNLTKKIEAWQKKGSKNVDTQIMSLNKLLERVQSIANITAADRTTLTGTIQGLITSLNAFKEQVNSSVSSSTLAESMQGLNQTHRVAALLEAQMRIISAADRMKTILNQMTIVAGKIQSRLAQNPALSANSSIQASLNDLTAKLTVAATDAQTAVNQVGVLRPDMGEKETMDSNNKVIKDARSKIKSAEEALKAGRKDLQAIVKILAAEKSITTSVSATTTVSGTSTMR